MRIGAILAISTAVAGAVEHDYVGPRRHAVPLYDKAPGIVVDGKLDEAIWAKAPDHTGFERQLHLPDRPSIPESLQTHFSVVQDDDTLYFGIRCNDDDLSRLVFYPAPGEWDAAMWMADSIELFIQPEGARQQYYHFAVDPNGTQTDIGGKSDYSTDWKAATFLKGDKFWSMEIAIPFAAFYETPAAGWAENWIFSITRSIAARGVWSTYSAMAFGYHDATNFGTLGPISVDKARFNLWVKNPRFQLIPDRKGGYSVSATVDITNGSRQAASGILRWSFDAADCRGGETTYEVPANGVTTLSIAEGSVPATGPQWMTLRALDKDGRLDSVARLKPTLEYKPVVVKMLRPVYRNNIYWTENVTTLKGEVTFGLPFEMVDGAMLRVTLSGPGIEPRSVVTNIAAPAVIFR